MAIYRENEDLINIGAYTRGNSPAIDRAIQMRPSLESFLSQGQRELIPWEQSVKELQQLVAFANTTPQTTAAASQLAPTPRAA
jgi:flagellum-specific ATP synthase